MVRVRVRLRVSVRVGLGLGNGDGLGYRLTYDKILVFAYVLGYGLVLVYRLG